MEPLNVYARAFVGVVIFGVVMALAVVMTAIGITVGLAILTGWLLTQEMYLTGLVTATLLIGCLTAISYAAWWFFWRKDPPRPISTDGSPTQD